MRLLTARPAAATTAQQHHTLRPPYARQHPYHHDHWQHLLRPYIDRIRPTIYCAPYYYEQTRTPQYTPSSHCCDGSHCCATASYHNTHRLAHQQEYHPWDAPVTSRRHASPHFGPTPIDEVYEWWPNRPAAHSYYGRNQTLGGLFDHLQQQEDAVHPATRRLSFDLIDGTPQDILEAVLNALTSADPQPTPQDTSDAQPHQEPKTQTERDASATTRSRSHDPHTDAEIPAREHNEHRNAAQPHTSPRPHPPVSREQRGRTSDGADTSRTRTTTPTPRGSVTTQSHSQTSHAQTHNTTPTDTDAGPTHQHKEAEATSRLALLWPFLTFEERQLLGLASPSSDQHQCRDDSRQQRRHNRHRPHRQCGRPQTSTSTDQQTPPPSHQAEVLHSSDTPTTAADKDIASSDPNNAQDAAAADRIRVEDSVKGSPQPQDKQSNKIAFSSTHLTTVIGPDGVPVSERVHRFTDSDGQVKTLRTRSIGADSVTDGDGKESTVSHSSSTGTTDPTSSAPEHSSSTLGKRVGSLEDFEKRWAATALGREAPTLATEREDAADTGSPDGDVPAEDNLLKTSSAATA